MYFKTAVILGWLAASYTLLVFFATSWWLALPLVVSLGLSMAAVGFNIQHDGGHQSYSDRPWINRLMASSLDLLGGSSYFWARKHNVLHHNYANIMGHDDDIDLGILGRLSPHQRRLPFHKFQHYYLWALYGFLPMKWQLYDDFRDLVTGRVGGRRFARPKGWDFAIFLGGKSLFFSLALAIPLFFHPLWTVLLFYLAASLVQGTTLSVVFQIACVRGGSGISPAAAGHGPNADGLGRPSGRIDRRFRPPQSTALLVHRRAEFPDRAPPLPPHLPCPLRGPCAAGREDLPGIRAELLGA